MKLKPADIDRILEENIQPRFARSTEDFAETNAQARDELVRSLTGMQSQSSAREGQILPTAPKSLVTRIDRPNDFGISPRASDVTSTDHSTLSEGELELDLSVSTLPAALRGCDLDKIETRADLMQQLAVNLPLNELGLPKIVYRADLLDWRLFCGASPRGSDVTERYRTLQQFLDMATLWLSYTEGFPTLPTGEPLWAKLPFEDAEHYAAFTDYCITPGARQLAKLIRYPLDHVTSWYHEDYWAIRVKCYDMLNVIHAAKVREQRVMACEDDHYIQAEAMLNKMKSKMNEVNWDNLVEDPKQFVEVMEKIVKLQRISLGLSSMGNADGKREIQSESLEVTMRRIAQPNLVEDKAGDGGMDVRALLRNPEALASAQELIIRMSKTITQAPVFDHEASDS